MNCANEFSRLYASVQALELSNFASPAALATITRTTGSTFRHAGSRMLVQADGDVVCALSGGCPQRDIVERAKSVISEGRAQLAHYNRESSFDILMEMGCGGELEILIEPLSNDGDTRFLGVIAQMQERREPGSMATVFAHNDMVVRPRRLVHGVRQLWSDFEEAQLSQQLVALGVGADPHLTASMHRVQAAGGSFDVMVERLPLPQVVILVGINPVSIALAEFATTLGWRGVLVDYRSGSALPAELPDGFSAMHATPYDLPGRIPADTSCAVVVMTFDVEHDLAFLRELAQAPVGYLGAIGSRTRAARMHDAVAGGRVRLHAPAGLDLGAENPQEIALAIAAEILAHGNGSSVRSLSLQTL
jgi:xanthine/CO dehydrogenase XdhC/CoxF family maturation factor